MFHNSVLNHQLTNVGLLGFRFRPSRGGENGDGEGDREEKADATQGDRAIN